MSESTAASKTWASERTLLLAQLDSSPAGASWCRQHTNLVDEAIRATYRQTAEEFPAPPVAVVATGGYGRRELAPYSDIDLTVIPSDEASPESDKFTRAFFQRLQSNVRDSMGLEIGYAHRLLNDVPALDGKSRTALLDARLVAGSSKPLDDLLQLYWETFPVGEFVLDKVTERALAFAKYNDTPLVVEPHLKLGAGGLRCLQTANWIKTALGQRPVASPAAYETVLKLRNLLHRTTGKLNDLFTRQRQAQIVELSGIDLDQLLGETAEAGMRLHEEYLSTLDLLHEARIPLGKDMLAIGGEVRSRGTPTVGDAAVAISVATRLGLRVSRTVIPVIGPVDGASALYAIGTGEDTIRQMDRSGVLSALLPELSACRTLMPQDAAHKYTVFEHTLRVVRNLDRASSLPFLGDLKRSLAEPPILYLAALLHDVGKQVHDRPHSESGRDMAEDLCKRWKLGQATTERVSWLVKEHLSMARFIRMRDVQHPQTVREFASLVSTQERLDQLTLLTWADIQAVSEDAWTPVQDVYLRELHERTSALLSGEVQEDLDPTVARSRLLKLLKREQPDATQLEQYVAELPTDYVVSTPDDTLKLHRAYALKAANGEPTVEVLPLQDGTGSEVTVVVRDSKGLLSKILGVIYALDISLHSIRAATKRGEPPIAIDSLRVSFGGGPVPRATAQQLTSLLLRALTGEVDHEDLLRERGKDPSRKQEVFTYTYVPGTPSILEVQAPRGRGMAYRFSRLISEQGWDVTGARVDQWAGRGAAAYYLSDEGGKAPSPDEIASALNPKV